MQACADDPQVCYHAVRNLARLGRSTVTPFWAVLGLRPGLRRSRARYSAKPVGVQGRNPKHQPQTKQYSRFVWIDSSDQPWLNGGTYQVVRKIRMLLETWDTDRIGNQQTDLGTAQGGQARR